MRVDSNQKEIVSALRKCGASVMITSQVPNFVDLVIGYRGKNILAEVKTKKGKLSVTQKKFISTWQGEVVILRSIDDVINLINRRN